MGRFFALTLNLHGETKPKLKRITEKAADLTKSHAAVWILVFTALFGILYLIEANDISTKGYEIRNLEQRMVQLQESNKKLELESASLKSIQAIENDVNTLNFVPSGSVNYPARQGYALGN